MEPYTYERKEGYNIDPQRPKIAKAMVNCEIFTNGIKRTINNAPQPRMKEPQTLPIMNEPRLLDDMQKPMEARAYDEAPPKTPIPLRITMISMITPALAKLHYTRYFVAKVAQLYGTRIWKSWEAMQRLKGDKFAKIFDWDGRYFTIKQEKQINNHAPYIYEHGIMATVITAFQVAIDSVQNGIPVHPPLNPITKLHEYVITTSFSKVILTMLLSGEFRVKHILSVYDPNPSKMGPIKVKTSRVTMRVAAPYQTPMALHSTADTQKIEETRELYQTVKNELLEHVLQARQWELQRNTADDDIRPELTRVIEKINHKIEGGRKTLKKLYNGVYTENMAQIPFKMPLRRNDTGRPLTKQEIYERRVGYTWKSRIQQTPPTIEQKSIGEAITFEFDVNYGSIQKLMGNQTCWKNPDKYVLMGNGRFIPLPPSDLMRLYKGRNEAIKETKYFMDAQRHQLLEISGIGMQHVSMIPVKLQRIGMMLMAQIDFSQHVFTIVSPDRWQKAAKKMRVTPRDLIRSIAEQVGAFNDHDEFRYEEKYYTSRNWQWVHQNEPIEYRTERRRGHNHNSMRNEEQANDIDDDESESETIPQIVSDESSQEFLESGYDAPSPSVLSTKAGSVLSTKTESEEKIMDTDHTANRYAMVMNEVDHESKTSPTMTVESSGVEQPYIVTSNSMTVSSRSNSRSNSPNPDNKPLKRKGRMRQRWRYKKDSSRNPSRSRSRSRNNNKNIKQTDSEGRNKSSISKSTMATSESISSHGQRLTTMNITGAINNYTKMAHSKQGLNYAQVTIPATGRCMARSGVSTIFETMQRLGVTGNDQSGRTTQVRPPRRAPRRESLPLQRDLPPQSEQEGKEQEIDNEDDDDDIKQKTEKK